uniref:Uncharacterized protein n=1 Tax=Physcomitrium patens TaxID=3218 RepID=A0A2K1KLB2_PHYPA|nr:hypothetical protein PHYPA_008244 [Physcomitrium patens]
MLEPASTTFCCFLLLIFRYCTLVLSLFEVDNDLSPCFILPFPVGG